MFLEKLRTLNVKLKALRYNGLRIIRLYGRSHEQKVYSNPCYNLTQTRGMQHDEIILDGKCLPELKEDALHYKIREKNDQIETVRQQFIDLHNIGIVPSIYEQNRYVCCILNFMVHILYRGTSL